jgi:hypothetical protein
MCFREFGCEMTSEKFKFYEKIIMNFLATCLNLGFEPLFIKLSSK